MGPTAFNAVALGVIGGADGPAAVVLANGGSARRQAAGSALRFQPGGPAEWRMVFYEKSVEDTQVYMIP